LDYSDGRSARQKRPLPPQTKSRKTYNKVKVKGRVVPVILIKNYTMKAYGGMQVQLHTFVYLGTRWR
jgi:hypothetical protein